MKELLKIILRFFYKRKVTSRCASYQNPLHVNYKTIVTKNCYLGKNVHFNGIRMNGRGKITIGNNFHSGVECVIFSSYHQYDGGNAIPYDTNKELQKDVLIEDNVWLGDRVVILAGVKIGEGAIIQVGSVVVNDIPKCAIAGGHPARVFKYRDVEHYEKLKKEAKFC